MADLKTLYARNREFASRFQRSDDAGRGDLSTVILTCVDARVFPGRFLGLDSGEAFVIRKPGARVSAEVERDVAVLATLAKDSVGEAAAPFELVIIHHTDCAMEGLANPDRRRELSARTGLDESQLLGLAIANHDESLREDIAKLRQSPIVPKELVVSGHIYDIETGALTQAVPPSPLAESP